jgi:hypothetical protein
MFLTGRTTAPVPEPGTALLIAGGLAVLARRAARHRGARAGS